MKILLKRFQFLPLFVRLTLFTSTILTIIFSALLFIAQTFYSHFVFNNLSTQAKLLADNLAKVSIQPLLNADEVSLYQNVQYFANQKNVRYITVLDRMGRIVASSFSQSGTAMETGDVEKDYQKILEKAAHSPFTMERLDQAPVLRIIHPIMVESTRWGTILMEFDLGEFDRMVARVRWLSILIGIIFILLGTYVIQKFSQKVVSPIYDVIKGTEAVSNGDFTYQITVTDEGELGQLARKFNEMTLKLNYYYKQKELLNKKLHEYSEKLEERIEERTRELQLIQKEVLQVFQQIPVGLLVVDVNGNIRWYNVELLRILGMDEKASLSKTNIFRVQDVAQREFMEKIIGLLRAGKKEKLQLSYSVAKNERLILEVQSQPLLDPEEKLSGMIFIIKDITLEVELEKKINRVQRLESMGILAGGIAHDFNNILAIILPNAQMLRMKLEKTNPELMRYIDTIEKATDQAAKITNQILSFARGSKKGELEILNLNELIDEFAQMFERVVDKKIQIKKELQPDLWNIEADKSQIEQILLNLSMNAKDAMPEGGNIIYKTSNFEVQEEGALIYPKLKEGKYIKLEVIDNGVGIPPQTLDKIFDPFFSSKKEGKGTGLGLSIVYGVIRGYNGFIDVHSEVNKGSHFTIYLPATDKEKKMDRPETETVSIGKGKILLVDDEEMLQQTLGHMLESLQFEVAIASDGQQAVDYYQKHASEIDLVIMDIQMPVLGGVEAAQKIWEINPKAKIIFSSGYADPEKLQELRRKGVKDFLRKPYKMKELVDIIQRVMNRKSNV